MHKATADMSQQTSVPPGFHAPA